MCALLIQSVYAADLDDSKVIYLCGHRTRETVLQDGIDARNERLKGGALLGIDMAWGKWVVNGPISRSGRAIGSIDPYAEKGSSAMTDVLELELRVATVTRQCCRNLWLYS